MPDEKELPQLYQTIAAFREIFSPGLKTEEEEREEEEQEMIRLGLKPPEKKP